MESFWKRLGIIPYLLFGGFFVIIGVGAMRQVTNYWPFEAQNHLDLVRDVAQGQATNTQLLEVALPEMILAFLLSAALALVGVCLPFLYLINKRISGDVPAFLVICRQSLGIGLWVAVCVYLQMNRVLGVAVALLLAAVFILGEIIFQVRSQTRNGFEIPETSS